MFSRAAPLARVCANVGRCSAPVSRKMSYAPGTWKTPAEAAQSARITLNDLPVPKGSWAEYHGKRNSKWNMQLAAATLFLVATVGCMYQAEVLYMHDVPDYKNIKVDANTPME